MHEVRELAGFVAREEESRTPHEKNLRRADAGRVQLVVHDDRARAMKRDAPALIAEALRGPTVRLAQRLAEGDLDPGGKVVVILLTSEVGDLFGDVAAGVAVIARDLAQEVEPPLRPERRAEGRLARDDHVGRAGSQLRRCADLRREACLSHGWRV